MNWDLGKDLATARVTSPCPHLTSGDFGPTSSYLAGSFQAGKSIENGVLLRQLSSLPGLQITAVLKDRVSGFSVSKGVGRTRFAFGKE
jgi:hypothetical protein